jgi:excisionase family DNA binding protein
MQTSGERGSLQEPPPLISVKEAARLLKVSRVMVYRRFHAGQIPGRRVGRKIDLYEPFVDALNRAICSGGHVDFDEFAATWADARATEAAALCPSPSARSPSCAT